jgi:hypothetical protein
MSDTPESSQVPTQENVAGVAKLKVVPNGEDTAEAPVKKGRFANFKQDLASSASTVPADVEETFATGFGAPGFLDWFMIDPRPEFTFVLNFVNAVPPGEKRAKLHYVAAGAASLPEIRKKVHPYAVHSCVTTLKQRFLWARRLPNPDMGDRDTWAITDVGVAERAKHEWVRRVEDETLKTGGRKAVKVPKDEEPPVWEDTPFDELLEKAIPPSLVIADDTHPLIVFARTGRVVKFSSDRDG